MSSAETSSDPQAPRTVDLVRGLMVRHPWRAAAVALISAAVVAFAVYSFYLYRQAAGQLALCEANVAAWEGMPPPDGPQTNYSDAARSMLGWFLLEWYSGRLERAAEIQDMAGQTEPPFGVAMTYLLDPNWPAEELWKYMPPNDKCLGNFVIAERAFSQGRWDEARQHYRLVADAPGDGWLRAASRARLEQLEAHAQPATASAPK